MQPHAFFNAMLVSVWQHAYTGRWRLRCHHWLHHPDWQTQRLCWHVTFICCHQGQDVLWCCADGGKGISSRAPFVWLTWSKILQLGLGLPLLGTDQIWLVLPVNTEYNEVLWYWGVWLCQLSLFCSVLAISYQQTETHTAQSCKNLAQFVSLLWLNHINTDHNQRTIKIHENTTPLKLHMKLSQLLPHPQGQARTTNEVQHIPLV